MAELRVLLNSYHSGANAWFALGQARGLFAAEGLNVEWASASGAYGAPAMMLERGFNQTFGDLGALIALTAGGESRAPAAVYAIHHRSPSAIAVRADGPIHAASDLHGRHLLTHASDVAYRSFPVYARAAGLAQADIAISLSDEPMATMLKIMLGGGADGVFGYASSQKAVLRQIDPALAERLRFLSFPEAAPDLYGSVMIASPLAMESKGAAIRAFLRALNKALEQSVIEPEAAVEAVIERNPALDRTVERARWAGTITDEMTHPEIHTLGFGALDPGRLDRAIGQLVETLPLARRPAARTVMDEGVLPPLVDRRRLASRIALFQSN